MSTKSFANSRFNVLYSYANNLGSGSNSLNGINQSAHAIGNDETSDYSTYAEGYLDFVSNPGSLPADASITKVVCRANVLGNAQCSNGDTGSANAQALVQLFAYELPSSAYIGGPVYANAVVSGPPADSQSYDEVISWELNFSPAKTRDELIALFGTPGIIHTSGNFLVANMNVTAGGSAEVTCSSTGSIGSWELVVTYTSSEMYSWYIKPTTKIVNGLPTRIIASPDDILAVTVGEDPPEGYELYSTIGSGPDFPDGPTYVWWYSPDFYQFYIYSPITPAVLGSTTWILVGGVPTCVNCTSVSLDEIDILVADASGIYKFDPTSKHDTLYVREGFSTFVGTEDVKIPNPFGKTGLVP